MATTCPHYLEALCVECINDDATHKHTENIKPITKFVQVVEQQLADAESGTGDYWYSGQSYRSGGRERAPGVDYDLEEVEKVLQSVTQSVEACRKRLQKINQEIAALKSVAQETDYHRTASQWLKNLKSSGVVDKENIDLIRCIIRCRTDNSVGLRLKTDTRQLNDAFEDLFRLQTKMDAFASDVDAMLGKGADGGGGGGLLNSPLRPHALAEHGIEWCFVKSTWGYSQDILEDKNNEGTSFAGTVKLSQRVYSSTAFMEGEHRFMIKVYESARNRQSGQLSIGIIKDFSRNTSSSKSDYYYHDLLSNKNCGMLSSYQGETHILDDETLQEVNMSSFLHPGDEVLVRADFSKEFFEIIHVRSQFKYILRPEVRLKNAAWRFAIGWSNSNLEIQLCHSS